MSIAMLRAGSVLYARRAAAGCAIGPDYKRPALSPPEHVPRPGAWNGDVFAGGLPWWQAFGDPTLQR